MGKEAYGAMTATRPSRGRRPDGKRRKDKGVLGDITDTGGLSNLTANLTRR